MIIQKIQSTTPIKQNSNSQISITNFSRTNNSNFLHLNHSELGGDFSSARIQKNSNISFQGKWTNITDRIKNIINPQYAETQTLTKIWDYINNVPYTKDSANEFRELIYNNQFSLNTKLNSKSLQETFLNKLWGGDYQDGKSRNYIMHLLLCKYPEVKDRCKFLFGFGSVLGSTFLTQEELNTANSLIYGHQEINRNNLSQEVYSSALQTENVPVLKYLTETLGLMPENLSKGNSEYFRALGWKDKYIENPVDVIPYGRNHSNPEISELFDDIHLKQLIDTNRNSMLLNFNIPNFIISTIRHFINNTDFIYPLANLYANRKNSSIKDVQDFIKPLILENKDLFNKSRLLNEYYDWARDVDNFRKEDELDETFVQIMAEVPISPREICGLNGLMPVHGGKDTVRKTNYYRLKNILSEIGGSQNLENNPDAILKCLQHPIMSPELLDMDIGNSTSIMSSFASIPLTENNREIMEEIMDKIDDMGYLSFAGEGIWGVKAAALNNRVDLIKFYKSRHVNLGEALSLKDDLSDEMKEVLKDVKPQFPLLRSLLDHSNTYDINSRDLNGNSLLHYAIKSQDLELFKKIYKNPEIDWNMTDSLGKTPLMSMLETICLTVQDKDWINLFEKCLSYLKTLPSEKFDVNYINKCTPIAPCTGGETYSAGTLFSYALWATDNQELITKLLRYPSIDPNKQLEGSLPPLYIPFVLNDVKTAKFLAQQPNVDSNPKLNGKTLAERFHDNYFSTTGRYSNSQALHDFFVENIANDFYKQICNLYSSQGFLTLQNLERIANYEELNRFVEEPINSIGETIAHMIAEVQVLNPDINNRLEKVIEKFGNKDKKNLLIEDDFGRTPLLKAIEAENIPVVKLLLNYFNFVPSQSKVANLLKELDNPDLTSLINSYINKSQ